MFAPEVVEEKLKRFQNSIGWLPTPHSIEEVDAFKKRMESVFSIERNGDIDQVRGLSKSEERFIANERAMCTASCHYFLTRYYYIKSKNKIHRFNFRQGQWILWQMLCELDRKGVSKMIQCLKARQLGISTLSEGIATWESQFIPGVAAQIGSADGQKTQIMLGMMTMAIDQLPSWLPPTQTKAKMGDRALIEFSRIGSQIMVQSGSIRGGMGQGSTPTFVHLSEVSQYTNPVEQLDEGLFKALHEGPELVVILESTGDASHRSAWWWKEQWIANRDGYWSGRAKFLPVFLPWHTTPELYPGDAWLKKFPMPGSFIPNEDTEAHVRRAEAYVHSTPMLSKIMGEEWKMPMNQKWYWEFNHEDHKKRRVEKSWFRQMPSDDYEALLGENDKVYGQEIIEVVTKTVEKLKNTSVYALVGDDIPSHREPEEDRVWYGEDSPQRLKTNWITKKGNKLEWMFVPLLPESENSFDPLEKFLIWKEKEDGFDYSIGADTGTGVGGDRTVLNVTRHGTDADPDVQVAEFTSDSIPASEIYVYIAALASLYAPCGIQRPHPKICIEMKRKFGDLPYHLARQIGLRRWHEWGQGFDRKKFKPNVGEHGRIGWFTNEWSRPLLLSAFQYALENGWYTVKSKWLSEEIAGLEQKTMSSGKTRVDHESGQHDDRVFAAAMAYWTMNQSSVMIERAQKRYESPSDNPMVIDFGAASNSIIIPGSKWFDLMEEKSNKKRAFNK